jgi:hypothetical protein
MEYHEATGELLRSTVSTRPPHIPNLPAVQRQALKRLRRDTSLIIGFTDKNCGLFAADAADYEQNGLAELGRTHERFARSAKHATVITLAAIRMRTKQYLPGLPPWALVWISAIIKGHQPATAAAFSIPAFRLLYKIHKSTLGFRPITGNHTWATQPLALLLAYLLLPFVKSNRYLRPGY